MVTALATATLMTVAKRDSKRNRSDGCGNGSATERVVTLVETLVASQISAAATTISAATAWTLVSIRPCWPLVGRSILG